MNKSKLFSDDVAQQLCDAATLVTATKRLARETHQQFNQYQLAQGKQVWETADILPFETWIFRLWQVLQDGADMGDASGEGQQRLVGKANTEPQVHAVSSSAIVLNILQSRAVWTQVIADDIHKHQRDSQPLWNIAATVKAAMQAWRICCQWDIAIDECSASDLDDHRSFARWAESFRQQCQKNNWIDKHQLIDVLIDEWSHVGRLENSLTDGLTGRRALLWMGFDGVNAQQQRLIDTLRQHNVDLSLHAVTDSAGSDSDSATHCQFRHYQSESEQWLAMAHWIMEKMARNPKQRLAVVAPNMQQSRQAIDYALKQILSPHHLLDTGSHRAKPFHISLGIKLLDAPVVDAALLLLSLATTAELTHLAISKVILSPFVGGADSECYARNEFEFYCRKHLPYQLRFADFLKIVKQWQEQRQSVPPIFLEKINANNALMTSVQQTHSFSQWAELFLLWLDNLGWPGESALNSEQYQTVEAFKREICCLGSLNLVANKLSRESATMITMASALAVLSQRLNEQPFEPESPQVSVDVLGIMETSSIEFDAIWFGNLTERDWPPPVQASPFILGKRQEDAGYHRASLKLNEQYAKAQQARLINQCDEMVLSRYCFEQDVALLPSALLAEPTKLEFARSGLIAQLQENQTKLETFVGTQGLGKADAKTRGGTAVIRDQAACPFRAYARHRLGARDIDVRKPGLSALERGSWVHRVLEQIWQALQSSQRLAAMSEHDLKHIIDDNIAICGQRFFHKSGRGKQFFRVQAQWLRALLLEWFEAEKNRGQTQAFRVVECETQRQLMLGKLILKVKIDRIDRLADNTRLLIDYKTGKVGSLMDWFGDRPKQPQLPLYALAQHTNTNDYENNPPVMLSALLFGQVRTGECTYKGIDQKELEKTAQRVARKISESENTRLEALKIYQDIVEARVEYLWPVFIKYWNEQLSRLADQYYTGHAEVNPLDKTTCRSCDLHGLCRIGDTDYL